MSRADEIRRELELLRELAELGESDEVEDEPEDEGKMLILLELLGEHAKQKIVQQVEDPTMDEEHFALAAVLDRASVEALEAAGWIDPVEREWDLAPPPPKVERPRLRPAVHRAVLPPSLQDQLIVNEAPVVPPLSAAQELANLLNEHPELADILTRGKVNGEARVAPADDDDMPEELRVNGYAAAPPVAAEKPAKPKKAKKPKKASVPARYADGSLVRERTDPAGAIPPTHTTESVSPPPPPAAPTPRQQVKAVYPPVRGKGTPPPAIAMGGLTSSSGWVRDPASGRMVPPDQVTSS